MLSFLLKCSILHWPHDNIFYPYWNDLKLKEGFPSENIEYLE